MPRNFMVFLAFLLSFVSSASAQSSARLPGGHWSISVPQGWRVVDEATLESVNRRVSSMGIQAGEKVQYVMMLVSTDREGCFALLQWQAALPAGASFDAFAKGITKGMDAGAKAIRESNSDQIASASFDSPVIDRQRQRLYIPGLTASPDGGTIKFISSPVPGSGETITFHGYSPSAKFDQNKPALVALADSFAFDPGYAYTFGTKGGGGYDYRRTLYVGLIGGAIGLVVWVVRKIAGR